MGILMLKIRRLRDRLIFNMGIPILVRGHLHIETAPGYNITCEGEMYSIVWVRSIASGLRSFIWCYMQYDIVFDRFIEPDSNVTVYISKWLSIIKGWYFWALKWARIIRRPHMWNNKPCPQIIFVSGRADLLCKECQSNSSVATH